MPQTVHKAKFQIFCAASSSVTTIVARHSVSCVLQVVLVEEKDKKKADTKAKAEVIVVDDKKKDKKDDKVGACNHCGSLCETVLLPTSPLSGKLACLAHTGQGIPKVPT